MATTHHVMRNVASPKTRAKLAEIAKRPWMFSEFASTGLSYQKCRLCGRGLGEVRGLWKYGVRHYACDDCREHCCTMARGR